MKDQSDGTGTRKLNNKTKKGENMEKFFSVDRTTSNRKYLKDKGIKYIRLTEKYRVTNKDNYPENTFCKIYSYLNNAVESIDVYEKISYCYAFFLNYTKESVDTISYFEKEAKKRKDLCQQKGRKKINDVNASSDLFKKINHLPKTNKETFDFDSYLFYQFSDAAKNENLEQRNVLARCKKKKDWLAYFCKM
jgi:hypothetical protein